MTGNVRNTLDDLAASAGVSRATTWRALKKPDSVSPKTREKVHKAAQLIGYVPNRLASALRSQSSGQVGLVIPELNYTFAPAAQAFSDEMARNNLGIILGFTGYDTVTEADVVRDMVGRQVAAIVLTGSDQSPGTLDLLRTSSVPVFRIWADAPADSNTCFGFSNLEVGAIAAQHFFDTNRRNPALLMTADRPRASLRSEGFEAQWSRLASTLAATIRQVAVPELSEDISPAMQTLFADPAPDALFVNGDVLALQAIGWCGDHGIRVPEDVGVLGFGNRRFSAFARPSISSIDIHEEAIGRSVGTAITHLLLGQTVELEETFGAIRLVRRSST